MRRERGKSIKKLGHEKTRRPRREPRLVGGVIPSSGDDAGFLHRYRNSGEEGRRRGPQAVSSIFLALPHVFFSAEWRWWYGLLGRCPRVTLVETKRNAAATTPGASRKLRRAYPKVYRSFCTLKPSPLVLGIPRPAFARIAGRPTCAGPKTGATDFEGSGGTLPCGCSRPDFPHFRRTFPA